MVKKTEKNLIEKAEAITEKAVNTVENVLEKTIEKVTEIVKDATGAEEKKKSKSDTADKKAKLAKLLEKAKKLESSVEEIKDVDLKKKVKPEEEDKKETLVPMEDYLKSSIHLGTRVITPDMRKYVYRRRADGLAVFNTALLDDKIRECAEYLAKFAPEEVILVCKREAGWKAVKKFAEVTGIRAFTKKYPAGILTNTILENFTEAELIVICDPWLDKNALQDANRIKVPVMSVCDTNNLTNGVTQVLPGNNKSNKSLGMILYLLTKLYVEKRGIIVDIPPIQEFVEGWDTLTPPK